jgi:integrase
VSQQRKNIELVKQVFRWGVLRELISRDRLSLYRFKVAKDDRSEEIPEYTPEEYRLLVPQCDPRQKTQWRAWALLILVGELGPRINAAVHLRWTDVDFGADDFGTVTWRARYDKQGHERVQPLTPAARDALYVALGWSQHDPLGTGWVFYSPLTNAARLQKKDGAYSVQSFWWMLRKAEDRAGVTHAEGGAAHRMRRMAAGNALDVTGNVADAMWWIGDTDLRQARKYLKKRDHRQRDVARGLSRLTGNVGEDIPKGCAPTVTTPQSSLKTRNAPNTSSALNRCGTETYLIDCIAPQVGLEPTTLRLTVPATFSIPFDLLCVSVTESTR